MFLADLHVHSHFSDGKHSIAELVDLYGHQGFGAIAITDHICEKESIWGKSARLLNKTLTPDKFTNYLDTLSQEQERAWQQYRMVLIPGVEYSKNYIDGKKSAHVLALGIQQFYWADDDVRKLAQNTREDGGITIAAHPVSTRVLEKQTFELWIKRHELWDTFDAWEVASGKHLFTEVQKSGLPMIANSDLHHRSQMTSWKTAFECERSQEAIFDAIRTQDLSFQFFNENHNYNYRKFLDFQAKQKLAVS